MHNSHTRNHKIVSLVKKKAEKLPCIFDTLTLTMIRADSADILMIFLLFFSWKKRI